MCLLIRSHFRAQPSQLISNLFLSQIHASAESCSQSVLCVWRDLFNDASASQILKKLEASKCEPMVALKDAAQRLGAWLQMLLRHTKNYPQFVVIIDEASRLLASGNVRLVAFNRVWSCLRRLSFWTFLLSTDLQVRSHLPPDDLPDPIDSRIILDAVASYRYTTDDGTGENNGLDRFQLVTYFEVSIEDKRRMRDDKLHFEERQMPLADVSNPLHLAIVGRLLWSAYTEANVLLSVVKTKLLADTNKYISSNVNQVFAVCSNRLALNSSRQTTKSLPLAYEAVRSHMRIVKSLDSANGTLATIAISKAILAVAAMDLLNAAKDTLKATIETFTSDLFGKSLDDKGRKGDLFSRLVVILAADNVRLDSKFELPPPERVAVPTFTVLQLLVALYGPDWGQLLELIPADILRSVMNVTHFVCTEGLLPVHNMWKQCHDLLRRTAALQLASN